LLENWEWWWVALREKIQPPLSFSVLCQSGQLDKKRISGGGTHSRRGRHDIILCTTNPMETGSGRALSYAGPTLQTHMCVSAYVLSVLHIFDLDVLSI
jgi:hypothetical protein